MASTSCEGIYYVVRYPTRWAFLYSRFQGDPVDNHYEWWEETVVGLLAAKWKKVLAKNRSTIQSELGLLTYAFPRGRISKVGRRFKILHGADLTSSMKISKKFIENAFHISGRCSWQFDEHEQCQMEDKEEMRRLLNLEEDWSAV